MNPDQIRQHVDNLIRQKGKNYRSLSMAIGKNEAYLHQYINKGSPLRLPEQQRRKLATLLDVNEQELTDIKLPKTIEAAYSSHNNVVIEMLSLSTLQTTGFWSLPSAELSSISNTPAHQLKLFCISGDAMFPTLKGGDYVIADCSVQNFTSDGLYLIKSDTQFIIRRLQKITANEVNLISDNTHYKSVSTALKKLKIAGKIIYTLKAEKIG